MKRTVLDRLPGGLVEEPHVLDDRPEIHRLVWAVEIRSRKTPLICAPPSERTTCVSEPVGSTTTISAAKPFCRSVNTRCSGRTPYMTGVPSEIATPDGIGSRVPPAAKKQGAPPSALIVPSIMFIEGEPMNVATNALSG